MKIDAEIWKDIIGYEGLYQISSYGNVKSLGNDATRKEKILKQAVSSCGYLIVCLHKNAMQKTRKVHQLVAIAFLNHTPCGMKLVVNHIDFNRQNNNINNLEIVTARENTNKKNMESSSRYTGVCLDKSRNKWVSHIRINGNNKFLGRFTNEIHAHNAYENALKNLTH